MGPEEADGGGDDGEHHVPLWIDLLLQWRCLHVQVYNLPFFPTTELWVGDHQVLKA